MLLPLQGAQQSVSLVSLDWTGEHGVIGDHCRLSQSTYEEVSVNGPVSDFRKIRNEKTYFFIDKGYHDFFLPGYTFTFILNKTC